MDTPQEAPWKVICLYAQPRMFFTRPNERVKATFSRGRWTRDFFWALKSLTHPSFRRNSLHDWKVSVPRTFASIPNYKTRRYVSFERAGAAPIILRFDRPAPASLIEALKSSLRLPNKESVNAEVHAGQRLDLPEAPRRARQGKRSAGRKGSRHRQGQRLLDAGR